MQHATLVSAEEYLTTSFRPDCEYLEGVLLERNVGEYEHARVQTVLAAYLCAREEVWGIRTITEQRVQVKQHRFRVPDICVLLRSQPVEPVFLAPPFLCVEILSKDDRMSEMQERIDDYLDFGVPHVWVVDPRTRRAHIYTPAGAVEAKDGFLRTRNPELTVPLAEIFQALA